MAAHGLNTTMPAAGQLFCLVDLGDGEGLRRPLQTDLKPRTPFPVDSHWYEAYWYGDRSGRTWCQAHHILRYSRAIVRRVAETIAGRGKLSVLES